MHKRKKVKTQAQAVARYEELFQKHLQYYRPCNQRDIDAFAAIQAEQAALEREFPDTLELWVEGGSGYVD